MAVFKHVPVGRSNQSLWTAARLSTLVLFGLWVPLGLVGKDDLDRAGNGWYLGNNMDILDQVARLLNDFETKKDERRASMELGKAIMLQAATDVYLDHIRKQEWGMARGQLDRVMMIVVNMIPDPPDGTGSQNG